MYDFFLSIRANTERFYHFILKTYLRFRVTLMPNVYLESDQLVLINRTDCVFSFVFYETVNIV